MLSSLWSATLATSSYASSSGAQIAQSTSASAFQAWPLATQISFVQANGTGDPPAVLIGPAGSDQVLATLSPDATDVQTTAVPADFSSQPGNLSSAEFQSWSPDLQQLYVRMNGSGDPLAVDIDSGVDTITATLDTTGGVDVTAGNAASAALAPTARFSLTAAAPVATPPAMPGSFWTSSSLVDNPAPPLPYDNLLGGHVGLSDTVNKTTANTLFPILDGDPTQAGHTLPANQLPADVVNNTDPGALDPAAFGSWPTAAQLQYLRANVGAHPSGAGYVTIGPSGGTQIDAFISAPVAPATVGTKVYVVQSLQKQDISKMTLADQQTLSRIPSFNGANGIATGLGLIPGNILQPDGTTAPIGPTDPSYYAAATNAPSSTALGFVQSLVSVALGQVNDPTTFSPAQVNGHMPDADKQIFVNELNNISTELKNSAVFSPKDIQDQINAITTRYQRANAFAVDLFVPGRRNPDGSWVATSVTLTNGAVIGAGSFAAFLANMPAVPSNATVPSSANANQSVTLPSTSTATWAGQKIASVQYTFIYVTNPPSSLDNNASITSGYQTFITQEQTILKLQNSQLALATTGKITQQNLDVPNLVYLFQLYSNLTGEAQIRSDTEEVNQTNSLLQEYGIMQKLINQTVASYDPKNTDQTSGLVGSNADKSLTAQERAAVAMFTNQTATNLSPIEILKGISRPVSNLSATNLKSQQWSTFGTELSDAVTLINQDSQIKMNDINSATKQKDRNFDLANSALSKMSDIVQKIASSTS